MFGELMRKIDDMSDGDMEVTFDEQFADIEELFAVNEWVLMSLTRHIEIDDVELHVKLRLDILQAVALMELLFPVKFAIFSLENNLMEMMGSYPFAFATCYSDKVGSLMQPVILTVIIVSITHVHKTVVNIKSGTATFIKGKYELPNWLIDSASQGDNPDEGTVHAIIRD